MTRENKLALVVGFALILLVGILVSDHFSTARRQEAARLTDVLDPLVGRQLESPDLIAVRDDPVTAAADARRDDEARRDDGGDDDDDSDARRDADLAAIDDDLARERQRLRDDALIEIAITDPIIQPVGLGPEPERIAPVFHEVRSGESLSKICGNVYGDQALALALARYNELSDPDLVLAGAGHRLRLPSIDDLIDGRTEVADSPAAARAAAAPARKPKPKPKRKAPLPEPPAVEIYTVRKGDMLSAIAARRLGSASKYLAIFEHNRDQLDSPDDIRAGMKLRIPREDAHKSG